MKCAFKTLVSIALIVVCLYAFVQIAFERFEYTNVAGDIKIKVEKFVFRMDVGSGMNVTNIEVSNHSRGPLDDCYVIINDEYKCPMSSIHVSTPDFWFFSRVETFGSASLTHSEILSFQISADVPQHELFINPSGDTLSTDSDIYSVGIESSEGLFTFKLE
ncbi:MAG: hypothetical protein NUW37_04315 [Planctomycetes bacterium]|nr:hypothetical protein [Planctomycetota bacterium]